MFGLKLHSVTVAMQPQRQARPVCLTSISDAELLSPSILTSRNCRAESRSSMAALEMGVCGSDRDTLLMWYCRGWQNKQD